MGRWGERMRALSENCTIRPLSRFPVCGSDGKTYRSKYFLRCSQMEQYGENIRVKEVHGGPCFIWEEHGISNTTLLFVS